MEPIVAHHQLKSFPTTALDVTVLIIYHWLESKNPSYLIRVELHVFCVTLPKKTGKVPLSPQTQKFPASFVDAQIGFTSHNTVSLSIEETPPDNHQPLEGHFSSSQHTRLNVSVHAVRYLGSLYRLVLPHIPQFRSPSSLVALCPAFVPLKHLFVVF